MQDFFHYDVGQLITIGILLFTIGMNWAMLKSGVKGLSDRMLPVEEELKKLREVVIVSARQEERMTAMDQRMLAQGKRFDDLYSLVMKRIISET
jgi:hypothetical protein